MSVALFHWPPPFGVALSEMKPISLVQAKGSVGLELNTPVSLDEQPAKQKKEREGNKNRQKGDTGWHGTDKGAPPSLALLFLTLFLS